MLKFPITEQKEQFAIFVLRHYLLSTMLNDAVSFVIESSKDNKNSIWTIPGVCDNEGPPLEMLNIPMSHMKIALQNLSRSFLGDSGEIEVQLESITAIVTYQLAWGGEHLVSAVFTIPPLGIDQQLTLRLFEQLHRSIYKLGTDTDDVYYHCE
jgi:hypothetical protein